MREILLPSSFFTGAFWSGRASRRKAVEIRGWYEGLHGSSVEHLWDFFARTVPVTRHTLSPAGTNEVSPAVLVGEGGVRIHSPAYIANWLRRKLAQASFVAGSITHSHRVHIAFTRRIKLSHSLIQLQQHLDFLVHIFQSTTNIKLKPTT